MRISYRDGDVGVVAEADTISAYDGKLVVRLYDDSVLEFMCANGAEHISLAAAKGVIYADELLLVKDSNKEQGFIKGATSVLPEIPKDYLRLFYSLRPDDLKELCTDHPNVAACFVLKRNTYGLSKVDLDFATVNYTLGEEVSGSKAASEFIKRHSTVNRAWIREMDKSYPGFANSEYNIDFIYFSGYVEHNALMAMLLLNSMGVLPCPK